MAKNEKKFPSLEEKKADEMEVAAQEDEKREKIKKTAQGWVRKLKIYFLNSLKFNRKLYK